MNDELKEAWQTQASQQRLSLDAGLVLNEVRRNERQFAATIFCRDVREVGVALLLVPVWIYMGIKTESPWSWYLAVPTLLWMEHQIWLLRNIFWWYLLPPGAAITVFPAHRAWQSRDDGLPALAEFVAIALVFALVGWFIYWLNQYVVRKQLEPRRQELQALLKSLNESGPKN
jgi:hypothetical protein